MKSETHTFSHTHTHTHSLTSVPPQGLTGHGSLAELDVSLNHIKSEGAQHLARLIVTLPCLQQLHVAAIGMKADGLQALSMQVCVCVCVCVRVCLGVLVVCMVICVCLGV
jgi:hypothetical protein